LLTKVFAQHRVTPNKVALVDQEPSMLDLVKSGVGLSLIRESIALAEAHAHGLVIADAVSLSTELSFIALARRRDEPAIAAVCSLLGQLWGG
ncbi:MAG: LysR substrate-binding domain-containing protein, partial [Burkholderiaceae bacterium]